MCFFISGTAFNLDIVFAFRNNSICRKTALHLDRGYLINQNGYSTLEDTYSEALPPPDPGQAEKNSLEKVVELRTGAVWEVPYIYWKPIPGSWTNHRKPQGCIFPINSWELL